MKTLKKIQISFVGAIIIPLTILNLLGGIISGIWLLVLGEWSEVLRGILFIIVASFVISLALMPSLLLAAPVARAMEKGKRILATFFGSLCIFYTIALIIAWCIWIMWLFTTSATDNSFIPLLIWSYGIALGPWMYLAQKDQEGGGNEFSTLSTFFAQISYIVSMFMNIFGATLKSITITFAAIMFVGAIIEILIVIAQENRDHKIIS